MRYPPRNPDFILESLQQSLIACRLIGQKLERHGLAQGEVIGAVHLAHATPSQESNDAISPSQQVAGQKTAFAHVVSGTGSPRPAGGRRPRWQGRRCRREVESE